MDFAILEYLNEIKSLITGKQNDKWLSISEVANYSNLSKTTLTRYVKRGELKASAKTGKLLFKRSDVDRWLNG